MKVWKFSKESIQDEKTLSSRTDETIIFDNEEFSSDNGENNKQLTCYNLGLKRFMRVHGLYGGCITRDVFSDRIYEYLKYGLFSRIKIGRYKKRCAYVYLYAKVRRKSGVGYFYVPIYVTKVNGELIDIITGITINTEFKPNDPCKNFTIGTMYKVSNTEVATLVIDLDKKQLDDYRKSIEEFNLKVASCYRSYVEESAISLKEDAQRKAKEAEAGEFLSSFQRHRGKKI